METTKTTLIEALQVVVQALENNTIKYDWHQISHCNCGLVAQAITGTNKETLNETYLYDISASLKKKMKFNDTPSWSEMVKEYCPLTGEPLTEVFKKLYEAGMKREDIAHLEYLDDPKILAASKIDTSLTWNETYNEYETHETGWIFKDKKTVTVKKQRKINYYQVKVNLIDYLNAWIIILKQPGAKAINIDGVEHKYRNTLQLENLKKHFLEKENYDAVIKIQNELDNK